MRRAKAACLQRVGRTNDERLAEGGFAAAQRGGKSGNAASDPSKSLPALGYSVLAPVAAGAFSTILRCRSSESGEVVAIKSFDNLKCAKDVDVGGARDRELSVLRLLAPSCHAHVANMLAELGDTASSPHVHAVLRFSEGGSLKRCA